MGGAPGQGARESLHVLVATDGRPQSDHALLAARRLDAERTLEVLTVLPRPSGEVASEHDTDDGGEIALRRRVDWQLRRVLGNDAKTIVDVRSGDASIVLATAAMSSDSLLVVGIGRPKVCDRLARRRIDAATGARGQDSGVGRCSRLCAARAQRADRSRLQRDELRCRATGAASRGARRKRPLGTRRGAARRDHVGKRRVRFSRRR